MKPPEPTKTMLRPTVRRYFRSVSTYRDVVPMGLKNGFTITELLIVLTLIGILSALSMPTLKGFAATRRLKASASTLRSLLTFARDMAVTDRTAHLVVFDFDNQRYWLASSETFDPSNPLTSALTAQNSTVVAAAQNNINTNSGFQTLPTAGTPTSQGPLTRSSGILGVPEPMEQNVTLTAMVTTRNGRTVTVDSGVAYIYFSPTSTSEEALVYLQNTRNQVMTVTVEAASGRVRARQLTSQEIEMLGFETTL
ncbi:prepilin-type N-terminal cleavage/methylation domain-containing protein [Candidatus Poribacteria bacterium]|nr:prepilin-type N-terminal cleavage/methylation domain-containing protein [Candidatus Poribacteria bacterium]